MAIKIKHKCPEANMLGEQRAAVLLSARGHAFLPHQAHSKATRCCEAVRPYEGMENHHVFALTTAHRAGVHLRNYNPYSLFGCDFSLGHKKTHPLRGHERPLTTCSLVAPYHPLETFSLSGSFDFGSGSFNFGSCRRLDPHLVGKRGGIPHSN